MIRKEIRRRNHTPVHPYVDLGGDIDVHFTGSDDSQFDALAAFIFDNSFEVGGSVAEEGHTGNGLYVVFSGNVEVIKDPETDRPQILNHLGSGDVFGEMTLLGGWPRL